MSNCKAIAAVSRTLRTLLLDRMDATPTVTIAPPDVQVTGISGRRVNLFLYDVSENGYLKNQEIPGQGHPAAYGHPPLSFDLSYLITVFDPAEQSKMAGDSDQMAQELLGDAMRVLHEFAIITEDLEITRPGAGTVGNPILDLNLWGEYEQVKLALKPLGIDELNKIWTALTVRYRLSAAYQVSVVQIESKRARKYPKIVRELPSAGPRVYVVPFKSPRIKEIKVRRQEAPADKERPFPYARIGDTLIISGQNLASETTRLMLGTVNVVPSIMRQDRIEVVIPDDEKLQPGAHAVKVVMDMLMGEPPMLHKGFNSNLLVFVLVPRLTSMTPEPEPPAAPLVLRIKGTRLFHTDLDCLTLIGDEVIASENYTTKESVEIVFELPAGLGAGDYAIRVRVNGVESIDEATLNIT